jgi:uncharacterized small protein (TIGR04563 family)
MTHRVRQSLYFPADMLAEIEREARRLERPTSWLIEQAWSLARAQLATYPSATPDRDDPTLEIEPTNSY